MRTTHSTIAIAGILIVLSVVSGFVGAVQGPLLVLPIAFIGVVLTFSVLLIPPTNKNNAWVFGFVVAYIGFQILWPSYISYWGIPGLPGLNPTRLMQIILLYIFLVFTVREDVLRKRLLTVFGVDRVFVFFLFMFMFWKLLAAIASEYPSVSLVDFFTDAIGIYCVFFVVIAFMQERYQVIVAYGLIATLTITVSVLGAIEYVTHYNPLVSLVPASSDFVEFALHQKERLGVQRIQSVFSHPLLFAEYLMFALPYLVAVYFLLRGRRGLQLLTLGGICITIIAAVLTGSRTTWGALIALAFIYGILWIVSLKGKGLSLPIVILGIATFLLIAILALFSYEFVLAKVFGTTQIESQSTYARIKLLKEGLIFVSENPIFGFGGTKIALSHFNFLGTIDNYYLAVAVEGGVPALLLLIGMFVFGLLRGVSALKNADEKYRHLLMAPLASIVIMLVVRSVVSVKTNLPFLFLSLGLVMVVLTLMSKQEGIVDETKDGF